MAAKSKPTSSKAEAARIKFELEAADAIAGADTVSQLLWTWLISQSPTIREVAYLQDGLKLSGMVARGEIHMRHFSRRQAVRMLRKDVQRAVKLLDTLKGK